MLPTLPESDAADAAAEAQPMSHTNVIASRAVAQAAGTGHVVIPVRGSSASGAASNTTSGTDFRIGGVAGSSLPVAVVPSTSSAAALAAIGTGDTNAFISSPLLIRGSRHTSGM